MRTHTALHILCGGIWAEFKVADLIPREIDPLRVIDIVGLDRQADGGTHVASTADVGRVAVVGTESKGKGNRRIRLQVLDAGAA